LKKCKCGYPLLAEEEDCGVCQSCFWREFMRVILRKHNANPNVYFEMIDGKRTTNPDEAVAVRGLGFKRGH